MISDLGSWLRDAGVLGMNKRNAEYIMAHNRRSLFPLVDNKVFTKRLAREHGIPTPPVYHVIRNHGDMKVLEEKLSDHEEFVIKPARGSGGSGIILVSGRTEPGYVTKSGEIIERSELAYRVFDILSGIYSLGGLEDWAVVEAMIHPDSVFEAVTFRGVPDIRIIAFRGVPVMAMVRLPTRASDGKANLHQGAIGAGIHMGSGVTLRAVHRSRIITRHPDTGNEVAGIEIPHWDRMLMIAARSSEMTGLGYIGVDIIMDRELGPVLLELNARPGLAIQMANGRGLLARLQKVDRAPEQIFASAESRIIWAKENLTA